MGGLGLEIMGALCALYALVLPLTHLVTMLHCKHGGDVVVRHNPIIVRDFVDVLTRR